MLPSRQKTLLRVVVSLVLTGLISHSTYAGSGDEPHYLAIAHSIAFDRDLDLANNYGADEPLIAGGGLPVHGHVLPGRGGVMRPLHDVGMPLLYAPVVRLLRPVAAWLSVATPESLMRRARLTPTVLYRHMISLTMIAVTVWMAGLLFDALLSAGAASRTAIGVTLLAVLSPPLLVHSALFFTEALTAALALFVFRRAAMRPPGTPAGWAIAGAAIGLLLLIHTRNAGLVLSLTMLAVLATKRDLRAAALLLAPLAAFVVLRSAVIHLFWGTLFTTPHAALASPSGTAAMLREGVIRLAGMTIDQEFGLLVYAPILILAPVGLLTMGDRGMAMKIGIVCACYLLPILWTVTNVHGWTGGWSPAARFMAPIVPLLALALPAAFARTPRPLLGALLAVQIGINAYMWQNPKNLWNDGDGIAAVCSRGGYHFCARLPSVTGWR